MAEYRAVPREGRAEIACIGSPTQYRIDIIAGLRARGMLIDFIQGFGEARDRRVAACKLLLNLHAGRAYRLWEPLRCARWLFAGMPIASESCDDAVPDEVHVVPVADLNALSPGYTGIITEFENVYVLATGQNPFKLAQIPS